ncbi:MAG: hypothetical protein DRR42_14280 [Gammaproteobacteria bacterium]|nr:MAG: hypothetical protein DRR42_14280 [Gammaproteobacteria bacterium]
MAKKLHLVLIPLLSIGWVQSWATSDEDVNNQTSANTVANDKTPTTTQTSKTTQKTSAKKAQSASSGRDFKPSEKISEDYSVPFPADI